MSLVSSVAAVIVGVAFVLAGGSKLAARESWPMQARGLGAPRWVIPFVPWVELVIGALLIVHLIQPLPALAALVLLVVFTVLIGRKLAAGERPACACFGAWSAAPIGRGHILRNAALAALAFLAAF